MAVQTRTTLAGFFNTGDKPTETQFGHLIDSSFNLNDGGTVNAACDIALAGLGTLKGPLREVIRQSADDNTALDLTVAQSGALILFDEDEEYEITLPSITTAQIGVHYDFLVTVADADGSRKVQAKFDDDLIQGGVFVSFETATATNPTSTKNFIATGAATHAITLDEDLTNGAGGVGSQFTCTAVLAGNTTDGGGDKAVWQIQGHVIQNAENGTGAAIFSDT